MVKITNLKIASLDGPRWAPFPGFSILFDNPGAATIPAGKVMKIACWPQESSETEFYSRLAMTIGAIDGATRQAGFFLCRLPVDSYHVTVWDGVNIENVSLLPVSRRAAWTHFVGKIPDSLCEPPAEMRWVVQSALVSEHFAPISFRFDGLAIWGDQVLVARLAPADQVSDARLAALRDARQGLSETAGGKIGVAPSDEYSPHVSLGYFANEMGGQKAHSQLKAWDGVFLKNLQNCTITYRSLGVYAFSDMANFFTLERLK